MQNKIINNSNIDKNVVEDFGKEWEKFNQNELKGNKLIEAFNEYFEIFPNKFLSKNSIGFDMGCGTGRWSKLIAPKVKKLNLIDPSQLSIEQAKKNLSKFNNCEYECESINGSKLKDLSQDFGYCLGVLHHIPDTYLGLKTCVNKLKVGAPLLLYIYYKFDNKPLIYKLIWLVSDFFRKIISKLPFVIKSYICFFIAITIYFPLVKLSKILHKFDVNVENIPLSNYKNKTFYFMKTDALDRFGTKLEKRFTKKEIQTMMQKAGLIDIKFSNKAPYYVVLGIKAN